MRRAAKEARYLLNRGYPKDSALRFVSDHHRLPQEQRYVLIRVLVASELARSRMAKIVPLRALRGNVVFVDGYNVLITAESLLEGSPVYLCDDGFLRDTRGIFKRYTASHFTAGALSSILDLLVLAAPARSEILLDQQMSRSGELAGQIRGMMAERCLPGDARTAKDVDRRLKTEAAIVASGDGNVIDASSAVVDLPAEMARMQGLKVLQL